MKNKPDDRSDNVEKIQYNIDRTILNCELADEMMAETEDEKSGPFLSGLCEKKTKDVKIDHLLETCLR